MKRKRHVRWIALVVLCVVASPLSILAAGCHKDDQPSAKQGYYAGPMGNKASKNISARAKASLEDR
jgi:hypothetical protein